MGKLGVTIEDTLKTKDLEISFQDLEVFFQFRKKIHKFLPLKFCEINYGHYLEHFWRHVMRGTKMSNQKQKNLCRKI